MLIFILMGIVMSEIIQTDNLSVCFIVACPQCGQTCEIKNYMHYCDDCDINFLVVYTDKKYIFIET